MATEINLVNDDITVNSVTGDGSGLTGLNASNLSAGTVPGARLPTSITLSGTLDAGTVEFDNLSGTSAVSVTDILDEDNMASNSATALATQQSIKAYVDTEIANVGGGGVTLEAVKSFLSASSTINNNTAFTQFNLFQATGGLDTNIGSFTSSTSGIVVPSTGTYIVMGNMAYNGTTVRANPEFRFSINGTGQSESSRPAYIRSASGHNSSSGHLTTIYTLTAGDEIGVQFRQAAAAGTVNLENTSAVSLYRIS